MSVPLRRMALDKQVKAAGGQALPDDANAEPHFSALLDECDRLIPEITFTGKTGGQIADATVGDDTATVTFDPNHVGGNAYTEDVPFRTACLLHEIMHVSAERHYRRPPQPELRGPWRTVNFHYGTGAASTFAAQCDTITANIGRIRARMAADNTLNANLRTHITSRLDYGEVSPNVHYDTVLLDLLVYLRLKGHGQANLLFAYLTKLSQEAMDRRTDPKGGPVPAAPAT